MDSQYIHNKYEFLPHKKKHNVIGFVALLFLYGLLFAVQFYLKLSPNNYTIMICGITAQVQSLLLVICAIMYQRRGIIAGYICSVVSVLYLIFQLAFRNIISVAPGIASCILCILTIALLQKMMDHIGEGTNELRNKNEELLELCDKVAASEATLSEQNKQLSIFNSALKEQENQLHKLAYTDTLTGLPNRKGFCNIIDELFARSSDKASPFSLVYMDIDNFKIINDSCGHPVGDSFLTEITSRFSRVLNIHDSFGRIGGDEFALAIGRELDRTELIDYLQQFVDVLKQPFSYENKNFFSTMSIGISVAPNDANQTETLIKAAETAMYRVKEKGGNDMQFYHTQMQEKILKRIEIETNLRDALKNNEFHLVYQPQFYSTTKELRGFETLLRWTSSKLGSIPPYKFIPILEETGQIKEVGKWVIETACRDYMRICNQFEKPPVLSINISPIQLRDPNFLDSISEIILTSRINPGSLEFEVTESVLISSRVQAAELLEKLHHLGVKIALDDFGTGYSSLSYLQDFMFDVLKIDKSFIDKISETSDDKVIVPAIIHLANQLGLEVVAEGVEQPYQLSYLQEHSCNFIQGYIWGKPWLFEDIMNNLSAIKEQDV